MAAGSATEIALTTAGEIIEIRAMGGATPEAGDTMPRIGTGSLIGVEGMAGGMMGMRGEVKADDLTPGGKSGGRGRRRRRRRRLLRR